MGGGAQQRPAASPSSMRRGFLPPGRTVCRLKPPASGSMQLQKLIFVKFPVRREEAGFESWHSLLWNGPRSQLIQVFRTVTERQPVTGLGLGAEMSPPIISLCLRPHRSRIVLDLVGGRGRNSSLYTKY